MGLQLMYELAVRTDQPACALSGIMHTPPQTGAAVVHTRAPENKKKCRLITIMQR